MGSKLNDVFLEAIWSCLSVMLIHDCVNLVSDCTIDLESRPPARVVGGPALEICGLYRFFVLTVTASEFAM